MKLYNIVQKFMQTDARFIVAMSTCIPWKLPQFGNLGGLSLTIILVVV